MMLAISKAMVSRTEIIPHISSGQDFDRLAIFGNLSDNLDECFREMRLLSK